VTHIWGICERAWRDMSSIAGLICDTCDSYRILDLQFVREVYVVRDSHGVSVRGSVMSLM